MNVKRMAAAAVDGKQADVVERVARPLERRFGISADDIRAVVGALFLVLALRRIARALRAGLRSG
jgi:hypothetical protein